MLSMLTATLFSLNATRRHGEFQTMQGTGLPGALWVVPEDATFLLPTINTRQSSYGLGTYDERVRGTEVNSMHKPTRFV
jgi:hypothetical protein